MVLVLESSRNLAQKREKREKLVAVVPVFRETWPACRERESRRGLGEMVNWPVGSRVNLPVDIR